MTTRDIVMNALAALLLAVWWFLVVEIGWDQKSSRAHNIIFGTIVFLIISVIYMFPAWVFFK